MHRKIHSSFLEMKATITFLFFLFVGLQSAIHAQSGFYPPPPISPYPRFIPPPPYVPFPMPQQPNLLPQNQVYTIGIRTEIFNFFAAAQTKTEWCWAASIQMILNYHGIPVNQDEVVQHSHGVLTDDPGTDGDITNALNGLIGGNNVSGVENPGIPPPNTLIDQLRAGNPILQAISTGQFSGHCVVITAASYIQTPMGPQVVDLVIRDPWPSPQNIMTKGKVEINGQQLQGFVNSARSYWLINVDAPNRQGMGLPVVR
jgi:hypothetical protein